MRRAGPAIVTHGRVLAAGNARAPTPRSSSRAARDRAVELLRVRFSSPLFRLGSAREIQRRVSFPTGGPDQTPGVIVMAIDGRDDIVSVPESLKATVDASRVQAQDKVLQVYGGAGSGAGKGGDAGSSLSVE